MKTADPARREVQAAVLAGTERSPMNNVATGKARARRASETASGKPGDNSNAFG